jgi:hypothetical protein
MQLRRGLLLPFLVGKVACSSRPSGCGADDAVDDVDVDLDELGLDRNAEDGDKPKNDCAPAGGTCAPLGCPDGGTRSTLTCLGLLELCCMPVADGGDR